jgi:hypothetical protein
MCPTVIDHGLPGSFQSLNQGATFGKQVFSSYITGSKGIEGLCYLL